MNPLNWTQRQIIGVRAILTFVVAFMVAGQVHAAEMQVTCTPSTKWNDGTTIAAGTPSTFKFWGALSGQTKVLLNAATTPSTCAYTWPNAPVGNACVAVTQVTDGKESDQSAQSCLAVTPPPPSKPGAPGAPVLKLVTTSPTVYNVVQGQGVFALLPVGTAPLGTSCDSTQTVNGLFAVPKSAVTLTNPNSTATVLVSACG